MEMGLEGLAAVKALRQAREAQKAAELATKEATAQVRALLGDAREGTVAGVTVVTVTAITRHGVDAKTLKATHPDIYAEVETTTVFDRVNL